jgi:hypothetical protein
VVFVDTASVAVEDSVTEENTWAAAATASVPVALSLTVGCKVAPEKIVSEAVADSETERP